jgi:hypothetical protein
MLQNPQIYVSTAIGNDVLAELAGICSVFQRSCITALEAFEFPKAKTGKLRAKYLGHLAHFSHEVKTIAASIGPEVNSHRPLLSSSLRTRYMLSPRAGNLSYQIS